MGNHTVTSSGHKKIGFQYFLHALFIFGGLGIEMLYAFLLEPLIYGHSMSDFTTIEYIIHWTITCITWGLIALLIIRHAKKELDFHLWDTDTRLTPLGIITSICLLLFMAVANYFDVGTLKIIHEFQVLGTAKFIFQHIYYLVEVLLFTLIIVFGQLAFEHWLHNSKIPYGGIVVGLTWGLAHWFTKNSILIGLGGVIIGFLFGAVYCFLGKDVRKTYLVLALAFIL